MYSLISIYPSNYNLFINYFFYVSGKIKFISSRFIEKPKFVECNKYCTYTVQYCLLRSNIYLSIYHHLSFSIYPSLNLFLSTYHLIFFLSPYPLYFFMLYFPKENRAFSFDRRFFLVQYSVKGTVSILLL